MADDLLLWVSRLGRRRAWSRKRPVPGIARYAQEILSAWRGRTEI